VYPQLYRLSLDVKEALKAQAYSNDGDPRSDRHFAKNLPAPNTNPGLSDMHLVLDTFRKNPDGSNLAVGRFQWNVMMQGETHDQYMGVNGLLGNVLSVQVSPFVFPRLPEVPYTLRGATTGQVSLVQNNISTLAGGVPSLVPNVGIVGQYPPSSLLTGTTAITPWPANPYTQTPCGNRFTLQFVEPGAQGYSDGPGNIRHHHEFAIVNTTAYDSPNSFEAGPIRGPYSETFMFTKPVMDFPSITLIFRGPDQPLVFLPDVITGVTAALDAVASPGPYVYLNLPTALTGADLVAGERILIEGFLSSSSVLTTYMNRKDGHVVNGNPAGGPGLPLPPGTPITGGQVWTDPAVGVAGLSPTPTFSGSFTVKIFSRRMRIPVRFRTIVDGLTNYSHSTAPS